ncbi:hypothetical protein [Phaeodactylibacter xiamenensis]|uniref:hypothetical protein n=1 Tax=Phaeodactylibacter xiamenensis TaxID=1524460 RepID=UPI0024A80A31|nr:hypothetical protein [Phaeodactylibacter xiamenensis]
MNLNAQDTPVEPALLEGAWQVDLRPAPDAQPYWQTLVIKEPGDNTFSGSFYGSKFKKGLLNTQWADLHLAFETRDRNNTYYHVACFDGKVLRGQTYCPQRKFIAPWTATKAQTKIHPDEP